MAVPISYPVGPLPPGLQPQGAGNIGSKPVPVPGLDLKQQFQTPANQANLAWSQGANPGTPMPSQGTQIVSPDYTPYLNAYHNNIQQSRAMIDKQLTSALQSLGQRRDAAAGVVAQIPQLAAANYNTVRGNEKGAQNIAGGIAGLAPGTSAAQAFAPLGAAAQQDVAGTKSMVPFMNLANMAAYQGGTTALQQQAMQGNQQLDSEQRAFQNQLLMAQITGDQSAKNLNTQHQWSIEDAQRAHAQTMQDQRTALAQQAGFTDGAQADAATNSPAYRYALQSMTGGIQDNNGGWGANGINTPISGAWAGTSGAGGVKQLSGTEVAQKYRAQPDVLRALMMNGYLTPADLASVGIHVAGSTKP
jgi:hypothetical protein